ncbi:MAG: apolipoprotein N-acyltransferase [Sulfurospirillum sp.]
MVVKKSAYLNRLACKSFYVKILRDYFTISYIIKGFVTAFCLSIFIYLEYFNIHSKILNSILVILGFYLLLKINKQGLFWSGFFIGIFWFYWISLSFRYYDLEYLIPFVILIIALIYGVIFGIIGLFNNILIRAFLFFGLSFFSPFGFNWLKLELSLIDTYFSTQIYSYALFLIAILFMIKLPKYYRLFCIPLLIACMWQQKMNTQKLPLHVKIIKSDINQRDKWNKRFENSLVKENFIQISSAIKQGYDLIIFPESAFPQYLNLHECEIETLKKLSFHIDIVAGGLTYQNHKIYNSSYHFSNGVMNIAHKVTLVPFGEEIPLPSFLNRFINKIFFNSANDYSRAKKPKNFTIKGIKFRSAVCFEATTDRLFENAPKQMIAISNNAWFKPSIEPTLQHLLLKFYAKRYNITIYHSANGGISGVIRP